MFKRLAIAQKEYYHGYELGEFDLNLERIKSLKQKELNEFIASLEELNQLSIACLYSCLYSEPK